MDGRVVCRVMIFSYRELEHRCELIDKAIYNTAVRSAFKNTMESYKEVERLIQEKIAYINVKVIIDQALHKVGKVYEIEQHHIAGVSVEKLAEQLKSNTNTIEHRLCRKREKLYRHILNVYSGEQLLDIICSSHWLMNRYKRELNRSPSNGR